MKFSLSQLKGRNAVLEACFKDLRMRKGKDASCHPILDGLNSLENMTEQFDILIQQKRKAFSFPLRKSLLRKCSVQTSLFVAVSSTLGVLILLGVVVVFVLLTRRSKTGDTTENVDINHDYHGEDYDESHAVVKDINEYYDLP
jgi:hypothetical protein